MLSAGRVNFSGRHSQSSIVMQYIGKDRVRNMGPLTRPESYINGQWVKASSGNTFKVFNPSNGSVIGEVCDLDANDTREAVKAAKAAFKPWSKRPPKERSVILMKWYQLMMDNADELAKIMTMENGKPLAESKGEIMYAASFLEWFASDCRRVYGETIDPPVPNKKSMAIKEPIGVAGIVIPWNFPAAMLTRKVGAAVGVGCTAVVKTPEDTPYTPMALVELAERAGLPAGVLNVVSCSRENAAGIGKLMCEDRDVATVSFTGSCEVGKLLMSQCSAQVKRVSLELGGLAPFIVFNSAEQDKVAAAAAFSKYRNAGQACIASQNFFVQEDVYDATVKTLMDVTNSMKLGDPMQPGVTIGPLINMRGLEKVERLVKDAVAKGATVLAGGSRATDMGELYYQPTVLANVTDDMDIVHDEVFGPVMAISKFKTEEEAIQKANATDRGLASYFFTTDLSQTYRVVQALETGLVGCNTGVISACECPFGGYKESGIGREGGHWGLDEYLQIKMVAIGVNMD